MKEKVIIEQLEISQKGQLNVFQLKVPADAKRIIGFEVSARGLALTDIPQFGELPADSLRYQGSSVIGEVRIQSLGRSNLFFTTEVCFNDLNIGFADFTQKGEWISTQWIKGRKCEEELVSIDECGTVLQGNYKDIIGTLTNTDLAYTIKLYLWYSTE